MRVWEGRMLYIDIEKSHESCMREDNRNGVFPFLFPSCPAAGPPQAEPLCSTKDTGEGHARVCLWDWFGVGSTGHDWRQVSSL